MNVTFRLSFFKRGKKLHTPLKSKKRGLNKRTYVLKLNYEKQTKMKVVKSYTKGIGGQEVPKVTF